MRVIEGDTVILTGGPYAQRLGVITMVKDDYYQDGSAPDNQYVGIRILDTSGTLITGAGFYVRKVLIVT